RCKSFIAQNPATSKFTTMQRNDDRGSDEIRPINFELNVAPHASGSVLVSVGQTRVICGVTIEETGPRWMKEQGVTGRGWAGLHWAGLDWTGLEWTGLD